MRSLIAAETVAGARLADAALPPVAARSALPVWILAGLCLAIVPGVIFPGDAPWVNDEALLVIAALEANAEGALAVHGLVGTMGLPYGPLPTWIYQGLILVTRDAVTLTLIHSMLLAVGTIAALGWLARTTRLWAPFAVIVALAPWIWFYDRQLWDNTFNIPISGLAFAAYAHFLTYRTRWALAVAVAGMTVAPFVHLMAISFVLPLATHLVVFERRALLRSKALALTFPAIFLALSVPYLRLLVQSAAGAQPGHTLLGLDGFLSPLVGGRYLSAIGFDVLGDSWHTSAVVDAARIVSALAYPLVWAGMVLAGTAAVRVFRGGRGVEDHLATLALGMALAQAVVQGVTGSSRHTHYFNSTWIAYAFLAWLAADRLVKARAPGLRALAWLLPLHGAALVVVAVAVTAWAHAHYPFTIASQQEVARELARYPPETPVLVEYDLYGQFPHALTAMRRLQPERAPTATARRLVVRRAADPDRQRAIVVPE